jgi:predicted HAD superfamily Cof-like phosphohydrolase
MADRDFYRNIERFNEIYRIPGHDEPTLLPVERIKNFQNILAEEVEEGGDIAQKYENGAEAAEVLTDMADWLGDIIVYCASEARRWGLPMDRILDIIMQSNFSKLDADGNPIVDARGKIQKGPNYWKPEPKLREMLTASLLDGPQG